MNTTDAFSIRHRWISPGLIVSVGWYCPLTSVDWADRELIGGSTIAPFLISTPEKIIRRSPLGGTRDRASSSPRTINAPNSPRPTCESVSGWSWAWYQ